MSNTNWEPFKPSKYEAEWIEAMKQWENERIASFAIPPSLVNTNTNLTNEPARNATLHASAYQLKLQRRGIR